MNIVIATLGALGALFIIIVLHELGHFFVARACGIKVLRFSLGFGKSLWSHRAKSGTEYVVAILPLGGYVKMLGEGEEISSPEEAHRAYNQKPLLARMAVVLAGPMVNFVLAIIAYWGVFLIGVQQIHPIIGEVQPHSIAAEAKLARGDQILQIDNRKTKSWQQVLMAIVGHTGQHNKMTFTVRTPQSKIEKRLLDLTSWHYNSREPNFLQSLGFVPFSPNIPLIFERVLPNSPAQHAGLRAGDRVVSIDHHTIESWAEMVHYVQAHPGQQLLFGVQSADRVSRQVLVVTGESKQHSGKELGYLGVEAKPPIWPETMVYREHYNVLSAWFPALHQTWRLLAFRLVVIGKMVTGKISLHTLGGPVTIFHAAGKASLAGWKVYLNFIGFLSLAIGFINLLPIPGLDGGHFFFQVIEVIVRRPVPQRIQMISLSFGMLFLAFLMVQATVNDIARLLIKS